MPDARFRTTQPHSELFLTNESVGFLMLTASGEIYRKWQGLEVGRLSVFSDILWAFSHLGSSTSSQSHTASRWLETTRVGNSVDRVWLLGCGCELTQTWSWPAESTHLDLSIHWKKSCSKTKSRATLTLTPQWTLCPAGHTHAGGGNAKIIHVPKQTHELCVESDLMPGELRISGLLAPHTETSPWIPFDEPVEVDVPTPGDAIRGENHSRKVLQTHSTSCLLSVHDTATLRIDFNVQVSGKAEHPTASQQTDLAQPTALGFAKIMAHQNHSDWQVAFENAQYSLNQLIRRRSDGSVGLQAGLPWFTQFWTRDLCHSFRAAFLWSGRIRDGHDALCQVWRASQKDIPNYTTEDATTTNSADALPLLLLSTVDLIDVAGLSSELSAQVTKICNHLSRAADVFNQGDFITHGPADTWMDAQKRAPSGELIACSPRANRAFEIQAFWIAAFVRWSAVLTNKGEKDLAEKLNRAATLAIQSLRQKFYNRDKNRWADHLRPDGSQDLSLRPNLLLGLSALQRAGVLKQLIDRAELKRLLDDMIDSDLIVPYGVRTLSPESHVRCPRPYNDIFKEQSAYIHENKIHFHPFHEFGTRHGLEHPDWAYHNGTIWPWLSHSAVQLLLLTSNQRTSHQLIDTLVWHTNQGTQGGALCELLDGLSSNSEWSWPKGAPHQAWSEAAVIHIMIEEIFGVSIRNSSSDIFIRTDCWEELGDFHIHLPLSVGMLSLQKQNSKCRFELISHQPHTVINVHLDGQTTTHGDIRHHSLTASHPITLILTH